MSAIGQPQWGLDPNRRSRPTTFRASAATAGSRPIRRSRAVGSTTAPRRRSSATFAIRRTNDYYSRSDPAGVGFTQFFPGAATFCNANANLPQNNPAGGCINDVRPGREPDSTGTRNRQLLRPPDQGDHARRWKASSSSATTTRIRPSIDLPIAPSGGFFTARRHRRLANGRDRCWVQPTRTTRIFGTAARLMYLPQFDTGRRPRSIRRAMRTASSPASRALGTPGTSTPASCTPNRGRPTLRPSCSTGASRTRCWTRPVCRQEQDHRRMLPSQLASVRPTLPSRGHVVAHRRERGPQLAGDVRRAPVRSGTQWLFEAVRRRLQGLARVRPAPGRPDRRRLRRRDPPRSTTSCRSTPAWATTRACPSPPTAARATSTRRMRRWLLPVLKNVELNGALRYDHYTDAGNSLTPKFGAKWRALDNFARSRHVRQGVPGAVFDREQRELARCLRRRERSTTTPVAQPRAACPRRQIDANCKGVAPTFIQRGNPDLEPEKSTSMTLGLVWDITPTVEHHGRYLADQAQGPAGHRGSAVRRRCRPRHPRPGHAN